jgi:hypothetical protein
MRDQPKQFTTKSIAPAPLAHYEPEFGRIPDVQRLFGLKRSTTYTLCREGKIKAVTIRPRGSRVGVKLISLDSVRSFLKSELKAVGQ